MSKPNTVAGDEAVRANLTAWEEVAPIHARHNQADLLQAFAQPGFSVLEEDTKTVFAELGVAGKAVAQLCCNNGRELISVKALGAGRCVGFDGSPAFVEQARDLNRAAGQDCEFVAGDIHAVPAEYDGLFDILYVTIGVLCWMPDLRAFFDVAARLAKPGGHFLIEEQHPILNMVEPGGPDDPVEWRYSYFQDHPFAEEGLDYYGETEYEAMTNFSYQHTMGAIINGSIAAGFEVLRLDERPQHISNAWYNVEKQGPRIPMSFDLLLRRHPGACGA